METKKELTDVELKEVSGGTIFGYTPTSQCPRDHAQLQTVNMTLKDNILYYTLQCPVCGEIYKGGINNNPDDAGFQP